MQSGGKALQRVSRTGRGQMVITLEPNGIFLIKSIPIYFNIV